MKAAIPQFATATQQIFQAVALPKIYSKFSQFEPRFRNRLSWEFPGFPRSLQTPFPSTLFPVYYRLSILNFDTTWSKVLRLSLKKPWQNQMIVAIYGLSEQGSISYRVRTSVSNHGTVLNVSKLLVPFTLTRTDEKPSAFSSRRNSCVLLLSVVSLQYRGTCVTTTSSSPPATSPKQWRTAYFLIQNIMYDF
jgi:hypothetical protein